MTKFLNFRGDKNPDTGDILTNPYIDQSLTVNGVLAEPDANDVVTLESGGTYHLAGRHYGRIVVGAADDEPTDDTFIYFDGVEIHANDAYGYGIYYAPQAQSLYVTLCRNTNNVIVCHYAAEIAEQQGAALYSENNMVVQGAGYLSVINRGGHGIKASELSLWGEPHIYCEAVHDAIHGNSHLGVYDGYYYINGANDAFGTGSSGSIWMLGGHYVYTNVKEKFFDSKSPAIFDSIYNEITVNGKAKEASDYNAYPISAFITMAVIMPVVTENGTPITPDADGVYNTSGTEGSEIVVKGRIKSLNVNGTKAKVSLEYGCITDALTYVPGSSVMQVNCVNWSVNVIKTIQSNNNLKIEVKGDTFLHVETDVKASELTFHDSKGALCVTGLVEGTDIYVADSADHKAYADEAFYGYLRSHTINARLSGKGKKGNFTLKAENHRGCFLADVLNTCATVASTGTGLSLGGSNGVFVKEYGENNNIVSGWVPCVDTFYDVRPYGIGKIPIKFK